MKLTNVSEADAELVYAIKQAAYFEHSVRTTVRQKTCDKLLNAPDRAMATAGARLNVH
jgi:hypothetical protein